MALSATAMGKIRLAAAAGESIPADWASDADGEPTTDPAAAIKGMLLPAAGPKGFGARLRHRSPVRRTVRRRDRRRGAPALRRSGASPIAAATSSSRSISRISGRRGVRRARARAGAARQRSKRAPDVDRIYAPGELRAGRRAKRTADCPLSRQTPSTPASRAAAALGIDHPSECSREARGTHETTDHLEQTAPAERAFLARDRDRGARAPGLHLRHDRAPRRRHHRRHRRHRGADPAGVREPEGGRRGSRRHARRHRAASTSMCATWSIST